MSRRLRRPGCAPGRSGRPVPMHLLHRGLAVFSVLARECERPLRLGCPHLQPTQRPVNGSGGPAGQSLGSCSPAEPCCVSGWSCLSVQDEESQASGQLMPGPAAPCVRLALPWARPLLPLGSVAAACGLQVAVVPPAANSLNHASLFLEVPQCCQEASALGSGLQDVGPHVGLAWQSPFPNTSRTVLPTPPPSATRCPREPVAHHGRV